MKSIVSLDQLIWLVKKKRHHGLKFSKIKSNRLNKKRSLKELIRGKNEEMAVTELLHINSTEVMEIYGLVKKVNDLLHIL